MLPAYIHKLFKKNPPPNGVGVSKEKVFIFNENGRTGIKLSTHCELYTAGMQRRWVAGECGSGG